jgi:catechol 2,3-dioxygenase-like lactoylglutathione lyase family enzyme
VVAAPPVVGAYGDRMRVRELDHIVLDVADVERSLTWYIGLLGLEGDRVEEWRAGQVPFPSVRVHSGCLIDLFPVERTGENMNHFCLVVDRADVDAVAADDRFTVVDGPGSRYGARGDGWSIYVLDPDGNTVELRAYAGDTPPGG